MKQGATIVNKASITAYRGHPTLIDYLDQGRHRHLHPLVGEPARREGHQGQCRSAWADMDAAHSGEFRCRLGRGIRQGYPVGSGHPNEVAPSHLFLACEDSSYMTGQVLHPNGGEMVGG
jgi:hypothetical protein